MWKAILSKYELFSETQKMTLKAKKSAAMCFSCKFLLYLGPKVELFGQRVPIVCGYKYLGFIITCIDEHSDEVGDRWGRLADRFGRAVPRGQRHGRQSLLRRVRDLRHLPDLRSSPGQAVLPYPGNRFRRLRLILGPRAA